MSENEFKTGVHNKKSLNSHVKILGFRRVTRRESPNEGPTNIRRLSTKFDQNGDLT